MKKLKKYLLIIIIAAPIVVAAYYYSRKLDPTILSPINRIGDMPYTYNFVDTYPAAVVQNLWIAYRDKIQKDGRTIDRSRDLITTSEGQSYSLLRSVWMDDKDTFDRVLKWTNNNLRKRKTDKLFAWNWGKNIDGKWDVIYDGGINTASDADQDIALALIFASKRWASDDYMVQAIQILNDMWAQEVIEVDGDYYLLAGNWAKQEQTPTLNPSYFSFAAFPIFAKVDPAHPWEKLKDTSYKVLYEATAAKLDTEDSKNIPPDWASLDLKTKQILPPAIPNKTTHFGDDAFRTVWRVALDWEWHKDPRAYDYLMKLGFLKDTWIQDKKLVAQYSHDGKPLESYESNSLYGGIIPYFKVIEPQLGREIFSKKLASLYDPDLETFKEDIGYYAQNWVWFGMALYTEKLPNLYEIER